MPATAERRTLTLELAGARVPAIGLFPVTDHPAPGVLLLHGYSSSKERLSSTMGKSLAARGIASLAIDLPLHGSRDDEIVDEARSNPFGLMQQWKKALAEARDAVAWLSEQPAIDSDRLAVAGYSLGSYIALETAASEPREWRWYHSAHILPPAAADDAATWLTRKLEK